MNILKALSKQLFGVKYESVGKSLIVCLILFFAIDATEIKIMIAPSILFLTAMAFSASVMWQILNSSHNADSMTGLFMLPFENRKMTFSFVLAFTGYTLITKTGIVLALFFTIHEWSAAQIAVSLLCACNGCFMAAAAYTMIKSKKLLSIVLLWCGVMFLSIFFVQEIVVFALIVIASLLLSTLRLLMTDAYVFYHPVSAKLPVKRTQGTGSVLIYLLRYMITNKNYLLNTVGLCVIAVFLPLIFGQFQGLNVMPLGFAVLSLNTPICMLLSCDPSLERAIRVLPGQANRFCTRYCLFLFCVNMTLNSVYLICWQIQQGGVGCINVISALLIALQSAILSVLLEWIKPIRGWKIESDLLHHPRKYVAPLLMMLGAAFIGIWSFLAWLWLGVLILECLGLIIIARRI